MQRQKDYQRDKKPEDWFLVLSPISIHMPEEPPSVTSKNETINLKVEAYCWPLQSLLPFQWSVHVTHPPTFAQLQVGHHKVPISDHHPACVGGKYPDPCQSGPQLCC